MQSNALFEETIVPYLRNKLEDEIRLYDSRETSLKRALPLIQRWGREDHNTEKHRFDLLEKITGTTLQQFHILDMAAGCGNFVFQGLKNNLNVEGIEPEEWKNELWKLKIKAFHLQEQWLQKFHNGIGEKLPFADRTFQIADSWQTFEHVQSVDDCMKELYRVITDDGFAVIRMPSYASFYEGHYMMPWIPYMHGAFAKLWLKMFNRPTAGLKTFYMRTQCSIKKKAKQAGFMVYDLKKIEYQKHLASHRGIKNKLVASALYHARMLVQNFFQIFRVERTVHVLLIKHKKNSIATSYLTK